MNNKFKNLACFVLIACSIYSLRGQVQQTNDQTQLELLSKAVSQETFWNASQIEMESLPNLIILDHGVMLNLPEQFSINGIPVEIVQKNQLSMIGDQPLIQIHTLNIEEEKALVRLYLTFTKNGVETTSNAEFHYHKNGAHWILTDNL